ncbi:MAG: chemotaxis protein CheA [Actinobacteria bacterium]|nr:MAG: chemotaxis protein CheA [Actinomycetota bacterium]
MSQYREVFLEEARELLQSLTDSLLLLEKESTDLAPVEECFRVAHSLKGMAATMNYEDIASLTHRMENFLDRVRKRERVASSDDIDLLLKCCDSLQAAVERLAGAEGDEVDLEALAGELDAASKADSTAAPAAAGGLKRYELTVTLDEGCVLKSVRAYMAFKRLSMMGEIEKTVPSMHDIEDEKFDHEFKVFFVSQSDGDKVRQAVLSVSEVCSVLVEELEAGQEKAEEKKTVRPRSDEERAPRISEAQSVRVGIGHLDNMVNLVGELVITRARLESLADGFHNPELEEILEELRRTSSELQHTVMQTRMVPVANIFNRFPRMVRDSARDLGKQVEFRMEGLDIELDRTVLDEIGDPIVHLLRNAVCHGIESPEERKQAGKPEQGTVTLRAVREQEGVAIVVEDDGRGLDPERLRRRATEIGSCGQVEAEALTDEEALLLICESGFSTVNETTSLAGRGVGMDAVKEKIESLGGSLHLHSVPGQEARFTLLLPLTLAIIQALLVESGQKTYAIPLSSVVEAADVASVRQKLVQQRPVMLLHDQVVPLLPLDSLLHSGSCEVEEVRGGQIVVVQVGEVRRGIVVDRLVGQQEVVIKPLDSSICGVSGVGGATVLGDGRVALIIDVRNLQERMTAGALSAGICRG